MPQSTVQITLEDQRSRYHNGLDRKVSDFKRYIAESMQQPRKSDNSLHNIESLLREAISLRAMFDIKGSVITLTRDDLNLLNRIMTTSA